MVRIGCIASFYHSKITAAFNQRWMIQLWLKTGWLTENWMHTQFLSCENCSRIELQMDDSFELTELGHDQELDAYPVFLIQELWWNWVISEIGSRMQEWVCNWKFVSNTDLFTCQLTLFQARPYSWVTLMVLYHVSCLSWSLILDVILNYVFVLRMIQYWKGISANVLLGQNLCWYTAQIFICVFICTLLEERRDFTFFSRFWNAIAAWTWNQFLSDSSCI